jgi:ammonia channel protein AmtB
MTMGIRVPEEEEIKGLDVSEHDMEAYSEMDPNYAFATAK